MSPPPLKRLRDPPPPYSVLDLPRLLKIFDEANYEYRQYHVDDFYRRLHKAKYPSLDDFDFHSFPKTFIDLVKANFVTSTSSVASVHDSSDGMTTKLLVSLHDGHRVESVIMRHETGRQTLCVSSQVGCKMGCTFCATGTMGIIGDLSAGEILEQLVHANRLLEEVSERRGATHDKQRSAQSTVM